MKFLLALTSLGIGYALSACGTYVNPCGTGSPNNPTCPPTGSSSSSSSSSGGSSSGSSSGSAMAAPAGFSIAGATYFDDFQRADTPPGSLGSNDQGLRYLLTARDGYIRHGAYTYSGSEAVSAGQVLRGTVRRIGATGRWRIIDTADGAGTSVVLGLGSATDGAAAQLEIGRNGWQYRDRLADGTLLPLAQGSFSPALKAGSEYWFDLSLAADNRSVSLTLPGITENVDDPAIGALLGSGAVWGEQPGQAHPADVFDFLAVWAAGNGQARLPASAYSAYDP